MRKIPHRQNYPGNAAMKRHPAVPNGKNLQRIMQIGILSVKQNITKSAAENNPQRNIEDQIFNIFLAQPQIIFATLRFSQNQPIKIPNK